VPDYACTGANAWYAKPNETEMTKPGDQLLPPPVQRYFDLVLPEGYRTIKTVKLAHGGFFKTAPKNNWIKIRGKQFFRTAEPAFEWVGRTSIFRAIDKFEKGRGSLRVLLLGILPIVRESGPQVDQGELLRWLCEGIWFPTMFLPSDKLQWHPVDEYHAKLTYQYGNMDLGMDISFNERGEIIRLETMRYKDKDKLERWIGTASDYMEVDGFRVPRQIGAAWAAEEGEFQYVNFYVEHLEYTYD
jgi:hypothetical protein